MDSLIVSSEWTLMAADPFGVRGDTPGSGATSHSLAVLSSVLPTGAASGARPRSFSIQREVLSDGGCRVADVATIEGVRRLALSLPRSYEVLIRDRVKFRVGQIVYLAFSRDEQTMGFAFPKDERAALVAAEPTKFDMPGVSDLRYNWVVVRLAAIDDIEMRELVLDAWTMVVPKRVAAEHLRS
jgi:hypothetical protein